MIVAGLVFGRWRGWTVAIGGLLWAAALLVNGTIEGPGRFIGAMILGAINTAVGVAFFLLGRLVLRRFRRSSAATGAGGPSGDR